MLVHKSVICIRINVRIYILHVAIECVNKIFMLLTHDYAYISTLELLNLFCCKSSATAAVHEDYKVNKEDLLSIENITDEVIDESISHLKEYFTDEAWEIVAESGKFKRIHT